MFRKVKFFSSKKKEKKKKESEKKALSKKEPKPAQLPLKKILTAEGWLRRQRGKKK